MVSGQRQELLVAKMVAGNFSIISGMPVSSGGRDEGPNPHELLEAALVACTIITAQMYADRKGIELESTDVQIKIVSEGAETVISREVSFRGNLTDEQKIRLTEIVDKCPIHKLLESKVTIQTKVS
ncbi:MAG: OsmC family protein [Bdellovibrionaceae bacterium]|nr:OsmC family protein [Pseudobdellovibrionaceae bacterium]